MGGYKLDFDSPYYLSLLALVPILWWFSYGSLAGLGRVRRLLALGLRTLVLVLFVLAAAEIQLVRTSERLTVIYLLDQSWSIPEAHRQAMIDDVNEAILEHREREDRVGVIVFAREASIEIPPFDDDVQVPRKIESLLDPEYTNLAGAIKLAQASFPEDAAKRVVVVSDGNQNLENALEQARGAVDSGIGIDVVPVVYRAPADVAVERVVMPADVRRGQPFDLRVVLNNVTETNRAVPGELTVSVRTDDQPLVISQQNVVLPPGKTVYTIRQEIDAPRFYDYEARFRPDNPQDDVVLQNNRATAFTHVRGQGRVLLAEGVENGGEHAALAERLGKENIEVTVRPANQAFSTLADLQQYDGVILANVPREDLTSEQVASLIRNTHDMGAGLIMTGGPNSFGAGGWTNTELEAAMPLDFQIKSAKVVPKGALALLMHASEMAEGNHWQKVIAKEAVSALGSEDYCGLLHYGAGGDSWLWGGMIKVGTRRDQMLARIDRMTPGDMPQFTPAMDLARKSFEQLQGVAGAKHMIIISDGDPSPPSAAVVNALVRLKVTVSTVAVGTHGPAGSAVMKKLSADTGGKYWEVRNPRALPKIFQREARRVARPLVHENDNGFGVGVRYRNEFLAGVGDDLPPLTGYVMTTVKQNPLVEVALVAAEPADESNSTVLASWTYGLGRSVCWTTDVGARWAKQWPGWEDYDKLFSQMVRWSMRPSDDDGKFSVATDVEDGRVKVVVTALDKDDEFINLLNFRGAVVDPGLGSRELKLQQTAPGRYVGSFEYADAGSYFIVLDPGRGRAPIRSGVNVPYSAEFRDRAANAELLYTLASLEPDGGEPGEIIRQLAADGSTIPLADAASNPLLETNTFRHDLPKATNSQGVWNYLLFWAASLFFFDVLIRRVMISFAWVAPVAGRVRDIVLRRQPAEQPTEYMDRLRTRKAAVSEQLAQKRATARFEPDRDAVTDASALEGEATIRPVQPRRPATPAGASLAPDQKEKEEDSYTSRLLKAKKKVWEDRESKEKGKDK